MSTKQKGDNNITYQNAGGCLKGQSSQSDSKKLNEYDDEDDWMTNVFDFSFDNDLNDIFAVVSALPIDYA